jgi:hypothetical protein
MDNKKVLAVFLIFILIMLLFRSSRNNTSTTTTTTTKVVATRPHYRARIRDPNYHINSNPYKAQYYN